MTISLSRPTGRAMEDRQITSEQFDLSRAFAEHGSSLLGFAVNALRDRAVAEDCVQETFLRAWRARARFDGRIASQRTWLFAIARNVIADALSARRRRPETGAAEELADQPIEEGDPLDRLGLIEGLAKLSPDHRTVLVRVLVEGHSYQELADETGVAPATLRTRAYYALRALRSHIEGQEDADA